MVDVNSPLASPQAEPLINPVSRMKELVPPANGATTPPVGGDDPVGPSGGESLGHAFLRTLENGKLPKFPKLSYKF